MFNVFLKVISEIVMFPDPRDILGYLAACIHGLPVKLLPSSQLEFTAWEAPGSNPERKKRDFSSHLSSAFKL